MASGRDMSYESAEMGGQAQMRYDGGQKSSGQGGTNFLQQTGENIQNAAQGAARGSTNAAKGAADIVPGVATAMKNTPGMNTDNSSSNNSGNYYGNPNTRN